MLPTPSWLEGRGGQPEDYCHRQMLDAIRYLVAGGISWRAMPADFPGRARVHAFFRRWRESGLVAEFHDRLRARVREREGRGREPTAGIIDAQSVKAAANVPAASSGFDGGKLINGRKRHIVTGCLGLLLVVAVTAANIGDLGRESDAVLLHNPEHPHPRRRDAGASVRGTTQRDCSQWANMGQSVGAPCNLRNDLRVQVGRVF
ncbi:transposase [Streptomyces sp. ISL-43]|uniref:transposase n=1 Tax=Streptomyces sp. ISL-43 TaxID=2819183 RepID=UPI0020363B76|nr:transposase [Streptomyces sp. ISL-43]